MPVRTSRRHADDAIVGADRSGKKGDYMGFTCPRNHYHEQDLPLVCGARLRF